MIDTFPIKSFGPINLRDDQYILGMSNPGAIVAINNMDFYEGGLRTRDGYTAYSSALVANRPVLNLYSFNKKDGTKKLIATCGTNVWVEGGTPGSFGSIKSGVTDLKQWSFMTIANLCIGVNGVSSDAFKYDGVTIYPYSITAPGTAPIVANGGAGDLSGTYYYKVTFVSKWGSETNAGPSSTGYTANSNQIQLSSIPTGGADIAKRNIYRTTTGGSVYYFLDAIENNITTTYSDNTIDEQLGTDIAPFDHDTPPNDLYLLAEWKQFVWGVRSSEPMRIYFSHQGYPEIFNTDEILGYYVEVGRDNGEDIIGIRKLQSAFYAFKENSTWPIVGDTPDEFKVAPEPINGAIGLYHRSMDILPDGRIAGLHRSGVYLFDGYRYENLSERQNDSIQKIITGLNPNRLKYATGLVDKRNNRYLLAVPEAGMSYNNKLLIYDYLRNVWTIHDIKASEFLYWNDSLIFASAQSDGRIHKIGGTNDNGAAISVSVEFPWWSLWDSETLKMIKFIQIDTTQQGTYEPLITAYIDGRSTEIPVWLEEGALWGSGKWLLTGGTYRIKKLLRLDRKGVNALKIKLSHSGLNQPITLAGMTVFGLASDRLAVL